MARLTISLPENIAEAAAAHAATQKRSASAYVSLLIEQDLQAAGLLTPASTPDLAEFIAKLQAAAAASPRIVTRLEAALRRELRPKKNAA